LTSKRSSDLAEPLRDLLRLLEALRLVARARAFTFSQLRDRAGVAGSASFRGSRKFRAYPRATSTTSPRRPTLSTSCGESTSIQFGDVGQSAISRARFTATATCRWCRRHAPVMRRERILPFSET
jgi:hypothetical protein